MKLRWMALLLAALLSTTACKRTDNTPKDVGEDDLNLEIEAGEHADPSEINKDKTPSP